MINKKTVFNFVYALAIVGMILSCFSLLNEVFNLLQLHDTEITSTYILSGVRFTIPFINFLLAFLIAAGATSALILHLLGLLKFSQKTINIIVIACSVTVLVISFVYIYLIRWEWESDNSIHISYYEYLTYYTLRTGIMSFIGNAFIVLGCHFINTKRGKHTDSTNDANDSFEGNI